MLALPGGADDPLRKEHLTCWLSSLDDRAAEAVNDLRIARRQLEDAALEPLAACLLASPGHCSFPSLQVLDLSGNLLTDRACTLLAECVAALKLRHHGGLRTLVLSTNQIGPDGAEALAMDFFLPDTSNGSRKFTLVLSENPIGDRGVEAVATAVRIHACQAALHLCNVGCAEEGCGALAESLPCLLELDLGHNTLSEAALEALVPAMGPPLQRLGLARVARPRQNLLGAGALGQALAAGLQRMTGLQVLHLAGGELQDEGLKVLGEVLSAPHAPELEDLDLAHNRLRNGNLLANLLVTGGKRLESLSLEANGLNDLALIAFSAGISLNPCLHRLNLARNLFGDSGAVALAQAFRHQCSTGPGPQTRAALIQAPTLRTWLDSLGALGGQGGLDAYVEPGMKELDLSFNMIADGGALALAEVPSLVRLNLYDTSVGGHGRDALAAAIRARHELIEQAACEVCEALHANSGSVPQHLPHPLLVQGLGFEHLEVEFAAKARAWAKASPVEGPAGTTEGPLLEFKCQAEKVRDKLTETQEWSRPCGKTSNQGDDGQKPTHTVSILERARKALQHAGPRPKLPQEPQPVNGLPGAVPKTGLASEPAPTATGPLMHTAMEAPAEEAPATPVADGPGRKTTASRTEDVLSRARHALKRVQEPVPVPLPVSPLAPPAAGVPMPGPGIRPTVAQVNAVVQPQALCWGGDQARLPETGVSEATISVRAVAMGEGQLPVKGPGPQPGLHVRQAAEALHPGMGVETPLTAEAAWATPDAPPARVEEASHMEVPALLAFPLHTSGMPPTTGHGFSPLASPKKLAMESSQSVVAVPHSAKGSAPGPPPPARMRQGGVSPKGKAAPPPANVAKGPPKTPVPQAASSSEQAPVGVLHKEPSSAAPFHRKLYWKPVDITDAEGTIFDGLQRVEGSTPGPHLDLDALNRMFKGEQERNSKLARRSVGLLNKVQMRSVGTKILSDNRARNVAIVLKRLSVSTKELARILQHLSWEATSVSTDDLEQILEVIPTQEEAGKLCEYRSPEARIVLRDVERLILPLALLNRSTARVRLMCIARRSRASFGAIARALASIRTACHAIHRSKVLREVMLLALELGNYINHGNSSKGAKAITIGSLMAFREFKTGRMSSLHFLCASMIRSNPERHAAEVLAEELRPAILLQKLQVQTLQSSMRNFLRDLEVITAECQNFMCEYEAEAECLEAAGADTLELPLEQPYQELEEYEAMAVNGVSDFNEEDATRFVEDVMKIRGGASRRLQCMRRVVEKLARLLHINVEQTAEQAHAALRFCGVSVLKSKEVPIEFEVLAQQFSDFTDIFRDHWDEVKTDMPSYQSFFSGDQRSEDLH